MERQHQASKNIIVKNVDAIEHWTQNNGILKKTKKKFLGHTKKEPD